MFVLKRVKEMASVRPLQATLTGSDVEVNLPDMIPQHDCTRIINVYTAYVKSTEIAKSAVNNQGSNGTAPL